MPNEHQHYQNKTTSPVLEDHAVKGQLDNKYDVVNGSERVQNNVDTEHLHIPSQYY